MGTAGQASVLTKLGICPFTFGLQVRHVHSAGTLFSPKVLDLTTDDICARFLSAVRNVASVSLEIGLPTLASLPHSMRNAFKHLLAVVVSDATDFKFPQAEIVLDMLANPDAYKSAGGGGGGGGAAAEEAEEEEAEEEEAAAVGDLFG